MGTVARERPRRLAEKLLQIRTALELSQGGMLRRLGMEDESYRNYISQFENGKREPSLLVLLRYARAARVSVETLIDDEMDLPQRLTAHQSSEMAKASAPSKKNSRKKKRR
jgi:transcriptional regulator with XRE-family HTH domain